jgi:acyl dehydratase
VTTTGTGKQPRTLNEDTIAEVRRRIGIPVRYSPRNHNEVSSTDSFRHFARAYGDDNPLYNEVGYASSSTWGSPIAPPLYPFASGLSRRVELSDAQRAILNSGDPLAGIGQYMCGERWLFPRPVRAGDVLWHSEALHAADLRTSTFGGGTGALVSRRHAWEDEAGDPFALRFLDFWHADREESRKAGKNRRVERPHYSGEDLDRIDTCYRAQRVRGATPRRVTDVVAGEKLGPIAKGPLSITDMVAWHIGVGWGVYGGGTSRIAYANRQRVPKFYVKNTLGFWDSAQSCHWDGQWAEQMGHPAAYDYGAMRTNWMVHLVTDWMGDDAWIWKVTARVSGFNYLGDMHMISGVVRDVDADRDTATVDVRGENQRGEVTCSAQIVVLLPPRPGGHARIPDYERSQVPEALVP